MDIYHASFLLAMVVCLNASVGALHSDIDEDAVDRILEEVELLSARNVREASQQTKPTSKPGEKKQKVKPKEQGCGKSKQEEPVMAKEGGRHKPAKLPNDEACPPPNLGHPYEVISMDHNSDDVEEEAEPEAATKPSVNQTAVFLNIIKDLKTLKNATTRGKGNATDGIPTHLTGVWLSETAGLRFSLQERPAPTTTTQIPDHHEHATTHAPRTDLHVTVTDRRAQPREKLLTTEWQFVATAPAALGAPFYMVATQPLQKRIAVFIGQAKMCSQKELIYGGWLFGKVQSGASCQDAELAVWTRTEVMRRGRPASSSGAGSQGAGADCTDRPN